MMEQSGRMAHDLHTPLDGTWPCFVAYAGQDRFPMGHDTTAISLDEMMKEIASAGDRGGWLDSLHFLRKYPVRIPKCQARPHYYSLDPIIIPSWACHGHGGGRRFRQVAGEQGKREARDEQQLESRELPGARS